MVFPTVLWYIPPALLSPPSAPKHRLFSVRCVDSVTDAYPFSCVSLRVFKQLENTSVLTEIVTVMKHHQPHRFSLFVFYFAFFLLKLEQSLALDKQSVHSKEPKIQIQYWDSTVARDVYNA